MHGEIDANGLRFEPRLEDVETLNRLALGGTLDVSKVSYGAIPQLLDEYVLLRSGGALGRGCGPLIVARPGTTLEDLGAGGIAIPGRLTTANLLLRLYDSSLPDGIETIYSEIMPDVERGEVAAGLIIHESRFTYPDHRLVKLLDLGEWWESETGLPIPLGGIVAKRTLGETAIRAIERAIHVSVARAFADPEATREYVRAHSQEMDDSVCQQHIDLYVNDFSLDLGDEGGRAVSEILRRAAG